MIEVKISPEQGHTLEEQQNILYSLKTVRDVCLNYKTANNGKCSLYCPFSDCGRCGIIDNEPDKWQLRDIDAFKAFV